MRRRRFLAAGLASAGLGVASIERVAGTASDPAPPGVRYRHSYENLWITGTASAHGSGRVLVGRKGSRPDPDDPVRVAIVDDEGEVTQRNALTPQLPEDAHATPDVVRTDDGYAVAAGPWLARLDAGLSVRSVGKTTEVAANKHTSLVSLPEGFVAGFTEWLPNAFWTYFVGFDGEGRNRWHREYDVNGSQSLGFLAPDGDGDAIAGGTFPWLAEIGVDGTFQAVEPPESFPSGALNAGVRDGDGLVLCSGSELVRLDADYAVDWRRRYDALAGEQIVELTATSDGGFLFLTGGVSLADALLCKTDASGRLQWRHRYEGNSTDDARIQTLVESSPGEYLVGGGYRLSSRGWTLRLTADRTPTRTPTEPSTATETVREPITETPVIEPPTDAPDTTTTVPGFGAVTGGLAVSGALVARALRESHGN